MRSIISNENCHLGFKPLGIILLVLICTLFSHNIASCSLFISYYEGSGNSNKKFRIFCAINLTPLELSKLQISKSTVVQCSNSVGVEARIFTTYTRGFG